MSKLKLHAIVLGIALLCVIWVLMALGVYTWDMEDEGSIGGLCAILLWDLLPILVGYVLGIRAIRKDKPGAYGGAIGFGVLGVGLVLLVHTVWSAGLTGGDALIFVVLPIYGLILGGIGYAFGWWFAKDY